jgi:hypothetical protein
MDTCHYGSHNENSLLQIHQECLDERAFPIIRLTTFSNAEIWQQVSRIELRKSRTLQLYCKRNASDCLYHEWNVYT